MIFKKKVLALVPARGGSKGIKLKNLKKINNQTLIEIASKFIDKLDYVDEKVLSTDHKGIIQEGKKNKFTILKRSKKTSGDFVSDFKVIEEALKGLKKMGKIFDILIYIQPTSPIRSKKQIDNALKKMIQKNFDSAWSISNVDLKFHPLKSLKLKNNSLSLFLKKGSKINSRQELRKTFIRNGIFYIFKINKLLNKKTIYLPKCFGSITKHKHVNIDDIGDLKRARNLIN